MPSFHDHLPPNPRSSFYNRQETPKPYRHATPPRDLLDEILEAEEREQTALKQPPTHLSEQSKPQRTQASFQAPSKPANRLFQNAHPLPNHQANTKHSSTASAHASPPSVPHPIETVLLLHPALQIPVPVKTTLVDRFLQQGYQRI